MPAAAIAVPAAVSIGSSIFSGIKGSRAANQAADIQSQAAREEAARFQAFLDQYNPQIKAAADQARSDVLAASDRSSGRLIDTAEQGAQGVTTAATQANEFLQPYMTLGSDAAKTLGEYMQPGGELNRDFTFADMQAHDPGYQFRIDQANKALAASAAAKGGALGGGALRAAMNLSQNLASSEYGSAFDRFRSMQTDRFNRFSNLIDTGVRSSAAAGQNLTTAADRAAALRTDAARTAGGWDLSANQYGGNMEFNAADQMANNAFRTTQSIADLNTGAANARASGKVASANAWTNAFSGIGNTAMQVGSYYQQKNLLNDWMKGMPQSSSGGYTPSGSFPNPWPK